MDNDLHAGAFGLNQNHNQMENVEDEYRREDSPPADDRKHFNVESIGGENYIPSLGQSEPTSSTHLHGPYGRASGSGSHPGTLPTRPKIRFKEVVRTNSNTSNDENVTKQYLYCSDKHPRTMQDTLNFLRKRKELCDVILIVGNKRLYAHRVILASSSAYFLSMFTSDLIEKRKTEIPIHDIDEGAMELLIDFCYNSKIYIDENNVQTLLPAACLLQMTEIQEVCCEFLKQELDASNCLGIRSFADTHACQDLLEHADKFTQELFLEVVQNEEFLLLPVNQLIDIISSDELNVTSEEEVYEAVMRWVNYSLKDRIPHLSHVLLHIRLSQMSAHYLVGKVSTDLLIKNDPSCRDLVDEAKNFLLLPQARSCMVGPRFRARKPIRRGEVLFAAGGWCSGDAMASVERYNPLTDEFKMVAPMNKRRCGVGCAVLNNYLYAAFGHDGANYMNSVERYDPVQDKWYSDVASSMTSRTSAGVGVLDGYLYAVGGQDGTSCLSLVERYEPETNYWKTLPSMNSKRLGVGVAILGGYLYAIGGSDGHCPLNSVEKFDPRNNRWTPVAPMSTRRKHLGAVVFAGHIIVCGGRDETCELNSAERYNPSLNTWHPIASMSSRRSGVGLAVVNGLIYAVGGFDGQNYLKTIEVYDPELNQWSLRSSMNYRRLGGGVGVVRMTKSNNE